VIGWNRVVPESEMRGEGRNWGVARSIVVGDDDDDNDDDDDDDVCLFLLLLLLWLRVRAMMGGPRVAAFCA